MEKSDQKIKYLQDEEKIRYLHIRRPQIVIKRDVLNTGWSSTGGLTVAFTRVGNCLHLGIARCKLSTHYNRKKGREIACKRLLEKQDEWMINMPFSDSDVYSTVQEMALTSREFRRNLKPKVH